MKIAIIGKAGTGKTTVAKLFLCANYKVICCDDIVHEAYSKPGVVFDYIKENCPECIVNNTIDRKKLGDILTNHDVERMLLEQFLYVEVFDPLIRNEENIVVDGLMPEYVIGDNLHGIKFDLVLYAYLDKQERHDRLEKRGMSKQRIKQIDKIQKRWHKTLLKIIK